MNRTENFLLAAAFCLLAAQPAPVQAQTFYDGVRVCWNYKTQKFLQGGVYSRLKRLSDGTLVCVYSAGSDVYIRRSIRPNVWQNPIRVSTDATKNYNYTNSELVELADGRLMYAWNARPKNGTGQPYKIMAAYSSTRGLQWRNEQTLYVAGTEGSDGCWEPAMMQLPDGEVQLFFANEHNVADNKQNITLLRSSDGGTTWSEPQVVSFRETSRDGMPVPLCLQDGKGLLLAIEDNGLNGNFKPVILHSTMADNWSGVISGSSSHRWSALAESEALAASVYAGAPYLIQLATGETLLSCQSSEGRTSTAYPIMQVYVGDALGRNFCCRSTPFPFVGESETKVQWCSMEQTDSLTVMATASVENRATDNGIWITSGRLFRPLTAAKAVGGQHDWENQPVGMFIGAESQAQAEVRTAWDADSLYVHFTVSDAKVVSATDGSAAWDSDGVEIYIDRSMRNATEVGTGMYKALANVRGETLFERALRGKWLTWTDAVATHLSLTPKGYTMLFSVPWAAIGNKPSSGSCALFMKLHNNDGEASPICHENMSGGNPDRPLTWIRCSFSDTEPTALPQVRAATVLQRDGHQAVTLLNGQTAPLSDVAKGSFYTLYGKKFLK